VRFKRSLVAGTAVAAVLASGGTAFSIRNGDGDGGGVSKAPPDEPGSAPITRGDVADTKTVDGTLTYSGERKVAGAPRGTVTSLPSPGRVIEQGEALYRVDRRPVTLMYGKLPLYRTLRPGIGDGPDVQQLERALRALGHGDGMTVDRHFSAATARAVRDWQDETGLDETGEVDAAQAVFLPSAVRVAEAKAAVGDRVGPAATVLTVTGTERLVHVDLKVSDHGLARAGTRVTIELPDGGTVPGRITRVGTVAETQDPQAAGQAPEPTIDVEIELTGDKGTGRLDQAPVRVRLESERREGVLTVPVEALLALREGGLGVEVFGPGGGRQVVAVRTGAYGGGRVEISGPGIAEGVRVGVPRE
jgi:peptidoglycan hydrolase-like protein with peptidoglycan-binding domain